MTLLTLSGGFIARGQSRRRDVEVRGHLHVVPFLLDEGMSAVKKDKNLAR